MNINKKSIISFIFYTFIFLVASYFILGELLLPSDELDKEFICEEYKGDWERITEDGERVPINVPGSCEAERNELVIIETTLPETIENNRYLCFRSAKQEMKIYVDGELRQEYSNEDTRLFGRLSAVAYVYLEMNRDDAGKTLRVETQTDSSYSGFFYAVYYGNIMGLWNYFLGQLGLELIVAFLTLILSIITIIGSITLRSLYHKKMALEYLGWAVLIAAVWLITNSTFRQIIFPNLSVINDITFLMIMLLTLPFLLYMNEVQKERYKKAYYILETVISINFIICSILHITGLIDFTDSVKYVFIFCFLTILLMIVSIILDIKKGYIREYLFVAVGMSGIFVSAAIQIITYLQKSGHFSGVILSLGLIFLLVFSVINTIREIMFMEREKQQALQESQSKGRFLANMSHEIRTPIHAILGMNTMILRESNESQIKEYALDIQNAGQTLLSLINDILDISKIESGKLEIILAEYDPSRLIHDIRNMIEMKARDKGLTLNLSVDEKMPSGLLGDDVRIRQILVNLMNNAVKYTDKGSVTLTVKAAVHGETADLTFRVEDTGIGIREEDMEKLFREFERIEEQRNRNIEGTGLGMSITTKLLETMGSKLQVESIYGKGSVFYFTLSQMIINSEPIGNLEERMKEQALSYSYQVSFTAPEARILIVDDNAINRRVFVNLLKSTKLQIDQAPGGNQCLELVREKVYDLIFLDHMMPDLDGVQVLHKMREWKGYPCLNTPVVALTANAVAGAREMYLKEGFADFLSKPVDLEKLEKMIMDLLPEDKVIPENKSSVQDNGKAVFESSKDNRKSDDTKDTKDEIVLPDVDGIDWDYAKVYCVDMDILMEVLHMFYDTIESEAAQLEEYMSNLKDEKGQEQALDRYRVKVHSMKNSAAMIGAVSLSGMAKTLEYAARGNEVVTIENDTPSFLHEWRSMKEKLQSIAEIINKEHTVELAPAPDYAVTKELLQTLKTAIEELDVDTADETMKKLRSYAYSENIMTEIMGKLSLAVTNLDEEQTVIWIEKFEQELNQTV